MNARQKRIGFAVCSYQYRVTKAYKAILVWILNASEEQSNKKIAGSREQNTFFYYAKPTASFLSELLKLANISFFGSNLWLELYWFHLQLAKNYNYNC